METIVFLVRHGETEWNRLGKFQGCTDIELSDEGIVQAKYLSNRFKNNFDYIYTSPLKRAVQTAEIICTDKKVKPLIVKELREINFGDWEGFTIEEISHNFPKEFNKWWNDKLEAPLCGGDLSIKKASIRARDAIKKIASKHNGKRIVIVAHGGIIKAGLIGIFNWEMTMYHKILLSNTAVCEIKFDSDLNPVIASINDTRHIPYEYIER